MVWMFAALVIVPLVIDHAYVVAPAGPAAVFPVEFAQTDAGDGVIVGVAGLAFTVTSAELVAVQPVALLTVSVSVVVPATPAVQVMVWMFVALVIVPLLIDQAYVVAPAGPLALLPVEAAQTAAGAVIAGDAGLLETVTFAELVAVQPEALLTVSVSVVVPTEPAVQVMVWMFVALVIVPLVIDHAYVVAPAGPLALLPVEAAQTALGAVIAGVAGFALMVTFVELVAEQPAAFVTVSVSVSVPGEPAV